MCKLASFLYRKSEASGLEICLDDVVSHSNTQANHPDKTERAGWYEGHYLPSGEIECRTPDGRDNEAEEKLRDRYPTFWALLADFPGTVTTLDLRGATLPAKLPAWPAGLKWFFLSGATLPATLPAWPEGLTTLDLDGCTLPAKLPAWPAGLKWLDLRGATLPAKLPAWPAGCDVLR